MTDPTTDVPASDPIPNRQVAMILARLAVATGLTLLVVAVLLVIGPVLRGFTAVHAVARAALVTGAAGTTLAAGLLALTGQLACLARRNPQLFGRILSARLVQGGAVPLLAAMAGMTAWIMGPGRGEPSPEDSFVLAGLLMLLAFLALIAERIVAGIRPGALPEATGLHALVKLPVAATCLSALGQLAMGAGLGWLGWLPLVLRAGLIVVAAEMALRPLARWFLPPQAALHRRAAAESLVAQLLFGMLARDGVAAPIRAQLGIDFSRSWALRYLRAAALPAGVATALFCWALSGLVMIDGDRRGILQRPGAPVAVLQPGLHLTLPWPLAATGQVELGTVHEIALSDRPIAVAAGHMTIARTGAEAPPPAAADRLWDQPHPGEVSYVIASGGHQGFQTVNADIRLLYRVGLQDGDALRAATATADPELLVRQTARRRLARLFASQTLADLLGGQREAMADQLRNSLAADLAPFATGIEVVAVVIEAIHPPAGAAAAYHAVQAAAIGSRTAVADASSRARATANEARQAARQTGDAAQAMAAETVQQAAADLIRFTADQAAHETGGRAFLVDRYFADLTRALGTTPLTIIDHRLSGPAAPVVDLRPFAGLAAASGPGRD